MEGDILKFDVSNRFFSLLAILVVGVLVFFVGQITYQQRLLEQQDTNQIVVSGEGKAYAKPDVATVSLGMRVDGQDIQSITQQNISTINKITNDLKSLQIQDKDIQTTQYSVTPQYNYTEKGGTVPNGYSIEQNILVKIRDFAKIGDVLSVASRDGANTIGALQFSIDNPDLFKQQARAEAILKAKQSAQSLAQQSGITLGRIINISETANPYPIEYDRMAQAGSAPQAVPQIQSGQEEIDVNVNITYQVK